MRITHISITTAILLVFASCAGMREAYIQDNCNRESAYAKGMNDARNGGEMNMQGAGMCPEDSQEVVRVAYREGYTAGVQSIQQPVQQNGGGGLININIGGGASPAGSDSRAWFCEGEAFMTKFEAFGPTRIEARQAVLNQCRSKYHEMHCQEIRCRPNQ